MCRISAQRHSTASCSCFSEPPPYPRPQPRLSSFPILSSLPNRSENCCDSRVLFYLGLCFCVTHAHDSLFSSTLLCQTRIGNNESVNWSINIAPSHQIRNSWVWGVYMALNRIVFELFFFIISSPPLRSTLVLTYLSVNKEPDCGRMMLRERRQR